MTQDFGTHPEKLQLLWRAMESSFNGLIITGAPAPGQADPDQYPIIYVNPAFEQMTGYVATDIIGHSPLHLLQEDERNQQDIAILRRALQEARETRVALRMYRRDGSILWGESLITPVRDNAGRVTHYIGILSDISGQREASLQRLEALQQLQRLSAHLQGARENERAHIARELHDELGQILTALKMDISFLHSQYPATPEIAGKLDDMTELVDATLASVRRISADLRPTILDDLGLKAAIEWLARDFEKRHPGIVCQLALELDRPLDDGSIAIACYRIVQECITNVARHAQASKIHIMVALGSDQKLRISVQDNGRGLPAMPIPTPISTAGGFGLIGMRERVAALGGRFSLESLPGEGVFVDATIPLMSSGPGPSTLT
jgi:PAS domain S-box-containing protein